MKSPELIPRLSINSSATYVWYADKPPKLGGTPRRIPVKEFEQLIGNAFCFTENVYYQQDLVIDLSSLFSQNIMENKVLDRLAHPLHDKLVICYMGNEVGYGVFAREDIPLGEIIGIYSGEVKRKNDNSSDYSLDVDTFTGDGNYEIDSKSRGGITRFIQHLPYHPNELAEKIIQAVKRNPALMRAYMEMNTASDNFSPEEREAHILGMTQNVINGGGEALRGMLSYKSTAESNRPDRDWEIRHLEFTNPNQKLASTNLTMDTIIINNTPVIYLWAERPILAGEQLGFSYGLGYWIIKKCLPLLFDDCGRVLTKNDYKYTEMPFVMNIPNVGLRPFYCPRQLYFNNIKNPKPIRFLPLVSPVSFYYVRDTLTDNNVIGQNNTSLKDPTTFMLELKKLFGNKLIVKGYERNPESSNINERYIIDVVCQVTNDQDWQYFSGMFRSSKIASICSIYNETKEIIVTGVNVNSGESHQFIQDCYNHRRTDQTMRL